MSFSNGYTYRRTVTVDHTKVLGGADLLNFPVLIAGTYSYLATVANGGKVESASGFDVRFETTGGTKLDHEVERWVAATGVVVYWVRIPTLDFDNDTVFYIYYGNASVVSTEENVAAVWNSSYKSVCHMHNASSPATDSDEGNNGTANGLGVTFEATGRIGLAIDFATGTGNYLDFGDLTILDGTTTSSHQFKMKLDTLAVSRRILGKWGGAQAWLISFDDTNSDELIIAFGGAGGNLLVVNTTDANLTTGTWYDVWVTRNGGTVLVRINGASVTVNVVLDQTPGAILNTADARRFGAQADGTASIDGILDEVRELNAVLTPDWIDSEYNNHSDPATFYTIGSEETSGTGAGPLVNSIRLKSKVGGALAA